MDYKTLSPEELLSKYRNDEEYEVDSDTMDGSNIPTKEIEFTQQSQSDLVSELRKILQKSKLPKELKNIMLNGK